ncbi:tRNA preQ1(34) S-adenosylmethionine ribosyltransferase-isomerase QueA [Deinococcus metallilatus]|uniref:S-adenosylmethionine:tRNA ribosyltransferase-isomerase n=1 Tax=Deinococcus metallilatus TaxID=1211322 RepID=A0AAJ5JXI8_9DEIO|nr:tRNA preQ1(34) S-adenosylmethionine ribosyltransferase-isomerase QueA [Deinococcus metallilatus]MBB5294315.1 S-adenosylmethionine:tRNA ribosyltransferase-isomerase [Deinococcus metallilatus]QBY09087.1 tRNA preQ1(34) S-adenosylmethionine ribosyltransferase-isomerase QueA [Deinococcus metallilatus]RXJ10231.1 tRNA preQ1(34) S-adenosylmethionine ribosyltransferase-isomerase QueA [Deinococcus metallilatus]TLK22523.1 tRNA preQ1(34) S-adenosylmethionine ribosyltransferase-isomerase QueA [Deinococcu
MNPDAVLARLAFDLPPERIAQTGAEPRDSSRLMVVGEAGLAHRVFRDLPELLRAGDVLVFNESRVIPARVMARKPVTPGGFGGGQVEVLLLREEEQHVWSAYLKPAKRAGKELWLGQHRAEVVGVLPDGARLLRFERDIKPHLDEIGRLPLPPYIDAGDSDETWRERYQTVYARTPGSVAAPTAGLHFTPELLARLDALGVERHALTLHVGAGTFRPITGSVADHVMHAERYAISEGAARAINRAKAEGRRVVAVGTTTVRALESSANEDGTVNPGEGDTSIFITPGTPVRVPDLLVTNLHLPGSTLLLLVAAFAGEARIKAAYDAALAEGYRFYSLGDAMLLERGL